MYEVLTFFDGIRDSCYYGVFLSMYNLPLADYLLDYIVSGCGIDCVECTEIDFFTHYAKSSLVDTYDRVKHICLDEYKIFRKQMYPARFPTHFVVEKSSKIRSMMLLDFARVYKIVELKRIPSRYGYSFVITLFYHIKDPRYLIMLNDFWLPKSCLPEIQGTKTIDKYGNVDILENQFIRVVDTKTYKGNKYVVIKSYTIKTQSQLRKPN